MEIPVAEMKIEGPETEYAITPDGTVVEACDIKENPTALTDIVK